MADPDRALEGAHLRLREVRFVTFEPGAAIPEAVLVELTREAARVAAISREERLALTLDRDWAPYAARSARAADLPNPWHRSPRRA